jgi:hypothetical protein
MVIHGSEVSVIPESHLARLDSRAIEGIKQDMELCQKLVSTVLEEGVDYGEIPGTHGKGLWDSGAAKVIRAFGCHIEVTPEDISYIFEALIIHNESGKIVGSGMGTCSTREAKYGYRWVIDPKKFGYAEEVIPDLRFRPKYGTQGEIEYRIENPDAGDLIHTLLVQACKRAEVDAAKSLPGVVSTLKPLFENKTPATPKAGVVDEEMSFKEFYTFFTTCGVNNDGVHKALGVASLKDWVASGKTLRQAREAVTKKLVELIPKTKTKGKPEPSGAANPNVSPDQTKSGPPAEVWDLVKVTDVLDTPSLLKAANDCWGLTEEEVWVLLGYKDAKNFEDAGLTTPWSAFVELKKKQTGKS